MTTVYPLSRLLVALMKTSVVHVGAAATSAALRRDLLRDGALTEDAFDAIFAASRLTPGTNLIALFAGLGHHFGGLPGALAAVTVGLLPAVAIALAAYGAYVASARYFDVGSAIAGGSAAAVAVLIWAGSRFAFTPWGRSKTITLTIVIACLILNSLAVSPVAVLVITAFVGAVAFRQDGP